MLSAPLPMSHDKDWTREAECLRDMAARARTPEIAAGLLRGAEAAERQAAWWRSGAP